MNARVTGFVAGLLLANSLPHLATAVTGRRHMIPGVRDASPAVNLAWAGANLLAGVALLRTSARDDGARWDDRLLAVEAGALTFSAWMFGSEAVAKPNHDR